MPELSNLLRQRLGAAEPGAGAHPDPDILTAFAEQSLPASERRQVLAHLAACAECRDVLVLSQPELSPATQTVLTPAQPFWRRLFTPAFGLAASAAAVAVIAVVVLQTPQRPAFNQPSAPPANSEKAAAPTQPEPTSPATYAAAAPAVPAQPAAADSFSGPQPADLLAREQARHQHEAPVEIAGLAASARNSILAPKSAAAPQPALTAGLRKRDYLNNSFFDTSNAGVAVGQGGNDYPAAPQPQVSSTEARLTAGNAPGQITIFSDIPPAAAAGKSNVRILTPRPAPERFGFTVGKLVTKGARGVFSRTPATAPAISSNSLSFSAMGSPRFSADLQKSQPTEVAAAPEKSEAAGLERTDALSGRSMSPAVASTPMPPAWKIIGGKLLRSSGAQWEDAYPAASFQFTAVNAHGNEVWAGGSHAALIHSRNAGANWETSRLDPGASGDIVSIVFLGNNIQVKTSDDQSWSSSDGGKTWTQN